MPVCYRKVNGKYYSPSEYKKLKSAYRIPVRGRRCSRCGKTRAGHESSFCEECGSRYDMGRN